MAQTKPTPAHAISATSRRGFLGASLVAAAMPTANAAVYGTGDDVIKVGLIGCGGRGTGAAKQALLADQNVKLTAMADVFEDRLQLSLKSLSEFESLKGKLDLSPDQQFVGFDAYEKLLATDVDVVLLTTPPHFRPMHLKAAIAADKHVFAEKPVAVDAPGVDRVDPVELFRRRGAYSMELYAGKAINKFYLYPGSSDDGTPWVRLNFFWWAYNGGSQRDFFKGLWTCLEGLSYRCHWGKELPMTNGRLPWDAEYRAKVDAFLQIRKQLDPNELFYTNHWKEILEPPATVPT